MHCFAWCKILQLLILLDYIEVNEQIYFCGCVVVLDWVNINIKKSLKQFYENEKIYKLFYLFYELLKYLNNFLKYFIPPLFITNNPVNKSSTLCKQENNIVF